MSKVSELRKTYESIFDSVVKERDYLVNENKGLELIIRQKTKEISDRDISSAQVIKLLRNEIKLLSEQLNIAPRLFENKPKTTSAAKVKSKSKSKSGYYVENFKVVPPADEVIDKR